MDVTLVGRGGHQKIDLSHIHHIGGGVNRIDMSIFGPEQAVIQANPFASQSKLKLALTRLPIS